MAVKIGYETLGCVGTPAFPRLLEETRADALALNEERESPQVEITGKGA
jgi:hypothetical protein